MKIDAFRALICASLWTAGCFGPYAVAAEKQQGVPGAAERGAIAPSSPTQSKAETPATLIDDKRVESVLGKEIRSASGEALGNVTDILVDGDGSVRAAIIDFGGFLGVGVRKIAVAWPAIHFLQDKNAVAAILNMNKDQLRVAPEYHAGEPIVIVGAEPKQKPSATPGKS